jgi:hypothetical protein
MKDIDLTVKLDGFTLPEGEDHLATFRRVMLDTVRRANPAGLNYYGQTLLRNITSVLDEMLKDKNRILALTGPEFRFLQNAFSTVEYPVESNVFIIQYLEKLELSND